MIDFSNNIDLTLAERRTILDRAAASQPYFELLNFELVQSDVKDTQYSAKVDVNKDFWITDIKGNFGEVFNDTASLFNLSIWTAQGGNSLFNYIKSSLLPTAFQTYEARNKTAFANQLFDDRQREIMPTLIPRGDSIAASIDNVSQKLAEFQARVVLAGYYTILPYISERVLQGINESLNAEIQFETWKFRVDENGKTNNLFNNDRTPRLVLGFGVVNLSEAKAQTADSTVIISDNVRGLRFNQTPIPIEFFAPRLTCLRDTHIYYLPVEYLLEPFAALRFETDTELNNGNGYEMIMLTRTV